MMAWSKELNSNSKTYLFSSLTEVSFETLSVYDIESLVKFRYKFSFVVGGRLFECYARTNVECKIWVYTFCRIIDFNNGISPEISGVKSTHFEILKEKLK